jgi:hypothetical protein
MFAKRVNKEKGEKMDYQKRKEKLRKRKETKRQMEMETK